PPTLPAPPQLRRLGGVVEAGGGAWVYWPAEEAVECVDDERLRSLRRHVAAVTWLKRIALPIDRAVTTWHRVPTGLRWIYRGEFPVRRSDILVKLTLLGLRAQPVSFDPAAAAAGAARLPGAGVYLRQDYWSAGRDDAHTSRVAAELAGITERVICLTPGRDR